MLAAAQVQLRAICSTAAQMASPRLGSSMPDDLLAAKLLYTVAGAPQHDMQVRCCIASPPALVLGCSASPPACCSLTRKRPSASLRSWQHCGRHASRRRTGPSRWAAAPCCLACRGTLPAHSHSRCSQATVHLELDSLGSLGGPPESGASPQPCAATGCWVSSKVSSSRSRPEGTPSPSTLPAAGAAGCPSSCCAGRSHSGAPARLCAAAAGDSGSGCGRAADSGGRL